jgi:hypothetical protein
LLDLSHGLVHLTLGARRTNHGGSGLRERKRNPAAHTASSTGDDRDATFKTHPFNCHRNDPLWY